jgi:methionyl aminopeptidase
MLQVTKESLYVGIREFKAGNRVEDVGNAIQKYTESFGYGVVRELVGHGLGQKKCTKCRTTENAVAKLLLKVWL